MKFLMKLGAVATASVLATAIPASAALIDFTDNSEGTPLNGEPVVGSVNSWITYTVTTNEPTRPNRLNRKQSFNGDNIAAISPLIGQNDGFGIGNDEITNGQKFQTVTVTFSDSVKLNIAYFLDVYATPAGLQGESARIKKGSSAADETDFDFEVFGTDPEPNINPGPAGFALIGANKRGTSFTFFAGPGKDDNSADIALAGLDVSAIPLPAGFLLLGTALGGLGLARRRKKPAQA